MPSVGRMAAAGGSPAGGGKSGLHGSTAPGNARRGRPQGKCHRKHTAGTSARRRVEARVKWCGKSAPRGRQRARQGKPRREQNRIGTARAFGLRACFRAAVRVGCTRRPATGVPDEWSSRHTRRTEPGLQAGWHDTVRQDRRHSGFPPLRAFPGRPQERTGAVQGSRAGRGAVPGLRRRASWKRHEGLPGRGGADVASIWAICRIRQVRYGTGARADRPECITKY